MAAAQRCEVGRGAAYLLVHRTADRRSRSRSGRSHGIGWSRRSAKGTSAMNHLFRELAPVSESAWTEIEEESTRTLKHFLTGRRLVDFVGPEGWSKDSVATGHTEDATTGPEGIRARLRTPQPLVEFRTEFSLDRAQIDAVERGARDIDLDPVRDAARHIAL